MNPNDPENQHNLTLDVDAVQDLEDNLEKPKKKRKFRTVDKVSKRDKKKKSKMSQSSYVKKNLQMISSALFLSGAVGMIVVGGIRFSEMEQQTVHDVILNFYFLSNNGSY